MSNNLYPSGIDPFPLLPMLTGYVVHPHHVSDLWNIVSGIEDTIGILPLNGFSSLSARITGVELSHSDTTELSGLVSTNTTNISFASGLADTNTASSLDNTTNVAFISGLTDTNTANIATASGVAATALQNVIGDTTPQLGANLDTNSFDIVPAISGSNFVGTATLPFSGINAIEVNTYPIVINISNEVPTPAADGAVTNFDLTQSPYGDSLHLYASGAYVYPSGVNSVLEEYSIISGNTIHFVTAPLNGTPLIANYVYQG